MEAQVMHRGEQPARTGWQRLAWGLRLACVPVAVVVLAAGISAMGLDAMAPLGLATGWPSPLTVGAVGGAESLALVSLEGAAVLGLRGQLTADRVRQVAQSAWMVTLPVAGFGIALTAIAMLGGGSLTAIMPPASGTWSTVLECIGLGQLAAGALATAAAVLLSASDRPGRALGEQ